jgi:protein SYS1
MLGFGINGRVGKRRLSRLIATDHDAPSSVYFLYHVVRRPQLILDFTLTLLFNHLVLTTYYCAVLPTSLFFWAVDLGSSFLTLLLAEQMCVKREMTEGLVIATNS